MNKEFFNVYIEGNLLQLISSKDVPFIALKEGERIDEFIEDVKIIETAIQELETAKRNRIVLHHVNLQILFEKFISFYTVVTAAGGVVQNEKQEILAIFRRGNWDFPKGKLEDGEKKRDCAIREVKEECGLKNVSIIKKLVTTYHTYGNKNARKLKESIWYVMQSSDKKLIPQTEEDIVEARWFKTKDFMLNAKPVYKNIADVFETYLMKFH